MIPAYEPLCAQNEKEKSIRLVLLTANHSKHSLFECNVIGPLPQELQTAKYMVWWSGMQYKFLF